MKKKRCITSARAKTDQKNKSDFISIVLLCDTPGYRMKSYGAIPLIPFRRKRLIDLQINSIKNVFNNFEVIICVGFDADKVCKYIKSKYQNLNIRIVENQLYDNSNSCEGVRLCLNNINNNKVIILDGSLLLDIETLYDMDTQKSYILTEQGFFENLEIGVNVGEQGTIEHFGFGAHQAWSEVLFLSNLDVIESLRKIISSDNFKHKFLFEGLNELIKTKHKLTVVKNKYPVKKINNIKTYHKLRDDL